jgi:hypothetical protein
VPRSFRQAHNQELFRQVNQTNAQLANFGGPLEPHAFICSATASAAQS